MQTSISKEYQSTDRGQLAESILRKCVHCDFCNATCPTYQLLGDELDGPRGRIYQMKLVFEGTAPTPKMLQHLDRCLTCRSCETTCPSGVKYSELLEVGHETVEQKVSRPFVDRLQRWLLNHTVANRRLFKGLYNTGTLFKPLLPDALANKLTPASVNDQIKWPTSKHSRKMIVLAGCVQPTLAPTTNLYAANVLDRLGIELIEVANAGCCGAVNLHTSGRQMGIRRAKNLIDIWYDYLEQGDRVICYDRQWLWSHHKGVSVFISK